MDFEVIVAPKIGGELEFGLSGKVGCVSSVSLRIG